MLDYQELAFAVFKIARMTDTPWDDIVEALTGLSWDEEGASDIGQHLEKIYQDFDND